MKNYFLFILIIIFYSQIKSNNEHINLSKSDLKGHWKLLDVEIVQNIPSLNLPTPIEDPMKMTTEDSPWDYYSQYDLVFENDSLYKINYPIQTLAPIQYFIDTGYLHLKINNQIKCSPIVRKDDTLIIYTPISEFGFFKEIFVPTKFNDSILAILKKYEINYPALAGTWILVREEDYDYGTHYELKFPHILPDSIVFTREQMIDALDHDKIYMIKTDGINRAYSFTYRVPNMYFTPGKWFKKKDDPMIHFYSE